MHNRLHEHFRTAEAAAEARISAAAADEAVTSFDASNEGFLNRTARAMASHPALAVGAAFSIGLLIGKWVKR